MYFWIEKGNEKNEEDESRKTFDSFEQLILAAFLWI
jgi:hypothetical protein